MWPARCRVILGVNVGTAVPGACNEALGPAVLVYIEEDNVNGIGNGSGGGSGTGFRPDELVKIQGRDFVVIGGRLRVLHAANAKVSITTELVDFILEAHAVARARVLTQVGEFTGTGVATAARDPKLAESLVELAETRAIARALRFAGVGVECCGFEELGAGATLDCDPPRQELRPVPVRADATAARPNGNGAHHPTPATVAQRRAIAMAAARMGTDADALIADAYPSQVAADLSLAQASRLIDKLRNGNGAKTSERR